MHESTHESPKCSYTLHDIYIFSLQQNHLNLNDKKLNVTTYVTEQITIIFTKCYKVERYSALNAILEQQTFRLF